MTLFQSPPPRLGRPWNRPNQAQCPRRPLLRWTVSTPVPYRLRHLVRGLIAPTPKQYPHHQWPPSTGPMLAPCRRHRLLPSTAWTRVRYPLRRSGPRRLNRSNLGLYRRLLLAPPRWTGSSPGRFRQRRRRRSVALIRQRTRLRPPFRLLQSKPRNQEQSLRRRLALPSSQS